jgi:hypothetical protein
VPVTSKRHKKHSKRAGHAPHARPHVPRETGDTIGSLQQLDTVLRRMREVVSQRLAPLRDVDELVKSQLQSRSISISPDLTTPGPAPDSGVRHQGASARRPRSVLVSDSDGEDFPSKIRRVHAAGVSKAQSVAGDRRGEGPHAQAPRVSIEPQTLAKPQQPASKRRSRVTIVSSDGSRASDDAMFGSAMSSGAPDPAVRR